MSRILRRLRCAFGIHRWATLYAPIDDGTGAYRETVTCVFCGREA